MLMLTFMLMLDNDLLFFVIMMHCAGCREKAYYHGYYDETDEGFQDNLLSLMINE